MSPHNESHISPAHPVLIAGAGPAGLMLGHWLHHYEIPFHLFEKKKSTHTHSRAIGIHPVSLRLFEKLGILEAFLRAGKQIKRGSGYLGREYIGTLDFTRLPFSHPYILTIPQYKTESILRDQLTELVGDRIHFNTELTAFKEIEQKVEVTFSSFTKGIKNTTTHTGSFLIGCDGRDSTIRKQSMISWKGSSYPDTYIMGDFRNQEHIDESAVIHLHSDGVVESFALPGGCRRWVVKTQNIQVSPTGLIPPLIKHRTGHSLSIKDCLRSSSFGVERYLASTLYQDRIILAGDAAHIVSPIGGQGMNLGWMGTELLAKQLHQIRNGKPVEEALSRYSQQQTNRARIAIRRAAFNMRLGRSFRYKTPRHMLIHTMINTPLRTITSRLFTMYGLDRWPI